MPTERPKIVQPRKLTGRIETVLNGKGKGRLGFATVNLSQIALDHEGIIESRHRGWTRRADARTPYLKRGIPIRNDRHISIVSVEDLAAIANALDVPHLDPAWLGTNLVLSGIPRLSFLPRGTHLFASGGAILTITDQNAPCTLAGEAIAKATGRAELKSKFPKVAQGLRGVVAAVEHPGTISADSVIEARLPAQWIYA